MANHRLFALSDPHLSLSGAKPMHVFGPRWEDHAARLETNWRAVVKPDDIVLMPGDISWGMRLPDALPDLEWLAELPGRKVLLRGNHDYWWQSLKKLEGLGLAGISFIQNNHLFLDGVAIGGTRLWDFPYVRWGFVANADNADIVPAMRKIDPGPQREEDPEKIRARELGRLAGSLAQLPREAALRVAMTHFPPIGEDGQPTEITGIIDTFDIDICVFGHVHALTDSPHPGADVVIGKTRYVLAASDYLGHAPMQLAEIGERS